MSGEGQMAIAISLVFGFGLVFGFLIAVIIYTFIGREPNTPNAIDVYRGKTELKITGTYKDSTFISEDSIVIFKDK